MSDLRERSRRPRGVDDPGATSRGLRTLAGAMASAVLLTGSLAGCSDERRAESVDEASGQVERTETISALNLVLVTNGDGVARLIGTLTNQTDQPDRLVGLDVDAEPPGYSVILADGPYVLVEDQPLELYRDANVTVLSEAFTPGYRADVTLVFANSAPLTTTVSVEPNTGIYRDVEVMRPPDGDIRPGS